MIKISKQINKIELLTHAKNYLFGGIFSKILLFLSILIFTHFLTPEDYGKIAIFGTLVAIFSVLFSLNLAGAVQQNILKRKFPVKYFMGNIIAANYLWIPVFLMIVYLFEHSIVDFFNIESNLFKWVILLAIFSIPIRFYNVFLLAYNQSKKSVFINISQTVITLLFAFSMLYLFTEDKYLSRVYDQIIATAIFSIFAISQLIKITKFVWRKKYLIHAFTFSLPLIPHMLSNFILSASDRIIINQILGNYETGIYAFAYSIGGIMMLITGAMNQAWVPIFGKYLRKKQYHTIENMAVKYSKIIYLSALGVILFAKELIILIADERYYVALDIVPIIALSGVFIFLYTLYVNYVFLAGKTLFIAINTLIAAMVNIAMNYWLIPIYGYQIAATTTLISYALLFALHYVNAKYILKQTVVRFSLLLPYLLWLLVLLFGWRIFKHYMDLNFIIVFVAKCLLLFGFAYFLFKQEALRLLNY